MARSTRRIRHAGGVLAAIPLLAVAPPTSRAVSPEPIAVSGQAAPGTSGGVAFTSFLFNEEDPGPRAHVNGAGQVRFQARLSGPSAGNVGYWGFDPVGATSLLARSGDPAPGLPAGTNLVLGQATQRSALAEDGSSAFFAGGVSSSGYPAYSSSGILTSGIAGPPALVLFAGDPAPDLPGLSIASIANSPTTTPSLPATSAAGDTFVSGVLQGPGVNYLNAEAIWGPDGAGGLALLLRSGVVAPGRTVRSFPVVAARPGCFAFEGILDGPPPAQQRSLWRHDDGAGLTLLGQQGFQAPGYPPGVTLSGLSFSIALDAACEALIATGVQGPGITAANATALFVSDGPGLFAPLVRAGDPAPGAGAGVTLGGPSAFGGERPINAAGAIAFRALLAGSGIVNDVAIYRSDASLELLARTGDPIENAGDTILNQLPLDPLIDDTGNVVFFANIEEALFPRYHDAIVLAAGNDKLYEIVKEGGFLQVAPGDWRQIDQLHGSPSDRGASPTLSGSGVVLFHASFVGGGSGLFTADVNEFVAELPDCGDGLDNDGDGLEDWGGGDPGCQTVTSASESPKCDDDADNDGDGRIDWDGGSGAATPDPQCAGKPWRDRETADACGLGAETTLVLLVVGALRRRRSTATPQA